MVVLYLLFISRLCTNVGLVSAGDFGIRLNSEENKGVFSIGVCNFHLTRNCPYCNVTFFLYTSENDAIPEKIVVTKQSHNLLQTSFNNTLETKILIHGYNSDMYLEVLTDIKDEYFKSKNLNIIFVNWSDYAKGPCYPAAVWNCKIVGKCVSLLLEAVRNVNKMNIHLIGFSLGSHIAGFASNFIRSKKVERITGLDPALPGFLTMSHDNKLDPSDANFVDVIHTNAFTQGTPLASGHVDFFVNGGIIQPGCFSEGNLLSCSHHRAPIYFGESINSAEGFWGWSCSSYWAYLIGQCWNSNTKTLMGEYTNQSIRGIFIVITNSQPAYAVGAYNRDLNYVILNNNELQKIANILIIN